MNEVKLLNIGGVDQNIKDQYARDVIAPSENGLDSSTNLPVSSRHYDEGAYLIGQDRQYYIAITEIDVGDTLVVGTNIRRTTVSDEIIALKNQSSDTVLEVIADVETGATVSKGYSVGSYLYWNYGLSAGMYKVIAEISTSDALVVDTNIEAADKIMNIISGMESKLDTINYSNHNVLDNPWFTVNQRGVTNAWNTQFSLGVDRWMKMSDASTTLSVTTNGITEVDGKAFGMFQVTSQANEEIKNLYGKVLTLSVMYSDGTIDKGSASLPLDHYLPSTTKVRRFINNASKCNFADIESYASGKSNIVVNVKAGVTIKAIKLELGSRSTLANDTAPNYTEELAKCQRYYQRFKGTGYPDICYGIETSSTQFWAIIPLPVPMRIKPSVIINGVQVYHHNTGVTTQITAASVGAHSNGVLKVLFTENTPGTAGLPVSIQLNDANTTGDAYIAFSADL